MTITSAKKPSKPKLQDPMVLAVVEFVANQCAAGAHLIRHELDDYRHKLGMTRPEVRAARDQALKLGLITQKQLPASERRGLRQHYLYAPGGKAVPERPAQTSITPAPPGIPSTPSSIPSAPTGNTPAQFSSPDKPIISAALLQAVLRFVNSYASEALAIEVLEAHHAAPAPKPTSLETWTILGETSEQFCARTGQPVADWGAQYAAAARTRRVWGGRGSGG